VDAWLEGSNLTLAGRNEREHQWLGDAIRSGRASSLYIPVIEAIDERLMSRFLAKVALEILAQRLLSIEGWEQPLIDDSQLDPLRRWPLGHARDFSPQPVFNNKDLVADSREEFVPFS
jgi:hypothetical protein